MNPNRVLEEQYKKQGSKCLYCNSKTKYEDITRDHLNPVSKGNTLINNKVFACEKCNNTKSNMTIPEFRNHVLKKMIGILKHAVSNKWLLSKNQVSKFRYYAKIFKNCNKLIKNGNKPEIIFT